MSSREEARRSVRGQACAGHRQTSHGLGPEATGQGYCPQVIPKVVRTKVRSEQQPWPQATPGVGAGPHARAMRRKGQPPPCDQPQRPGGSLFKHQGSKLFKTNSLAKWFSLGLSKQIAFLTVLPKKVKPPLTGWPRSSPRSLLLGGRGKAGQWGECS